MQLFCKSEKTSKSKAFWFLQKNSSSCSSLPTLKKKNRQDLSILTSPFMLLYFTKSMSQGYFPSQNSPGPLLLQELCSQWLFLKLAPCLPAAGPVMLVQKGQSWAQLPRESPTVHTPHSGCWAFFGLQHSSPSLELENAFAGGTLSLERSTTCSPSLFSPPTPQRHLTPGRG